MDLHAPGTTCDATLCTSCSILLWQFLSLKQLPNRKPPKRLKTDWGEMSSSDVQLLAFIHSILEGSTGSAWSLLQFVNSSLCSIKSRSKFQGRRMMEVPLRFRYVSEVKVQWGRMECDLLGADEGDALWFLRTTLEEGSCLMVESSELSSFKQSKFPEFSWKFPSSDQPEKSVIAVPSRQSFDKYGICCGTSGNFSSFEQPERIRVSRDTNQRMLGRCSRFVQFSKFNKMSLLKYPREGWTLRKFVHPLRTKTSRFVALEKSGVSFRYWE